VLVILCNDLFHLAYLFPYKKVTHDCAASKMTDDENKLRMAVKEEPLEPELGLEKMSTTPEFEVEKVSCKSETEPSILESTNIKEESTEGTTVCQFCKKDVDVKEI
jgi:hypothetical protein